MATAITSLPGISAVDVSCGAEDSQGGREWLVTFISAGGGGDIPTLITSSVNLSGVGARIEVNEIQRGFGRPELWVISTYAPRRDIVLELTLTHLNLENNFSNPGFVTLFDKNQQLLTWMNGGHVYPQTVSMKSNEEPSAAMKWWSAWVEEGGLPGTRKGESIQSIMESENIGINSEASVDVVKIIATDKTRATWIITVKNAMYNISIPELDDSNWNGPPGSALLRVISSRDEISGNFTIRVNEVSTRSLSVEASANDVSEAVNELEQDLGARVVVARSPYKDFEGGYTWYMAFVSDPRSQLDVVYSVDTIGDLDWGGISARCVQRGGSEGSFMWLQSWGEGLKVVGGVTNRSNTIDLLGTPVAMNEALRNLEYKSSSTWSGIVFFHVFVSSPLKPHDYTDNKTISILVSPHRHAPEILWCNSLLLEDGLQTQTVAYLLEDSPLSFGKYNCETTRGELAVTSHVEFDAHSEFNSKGGSVLSIKDPDNSVAASLSLNISVGHGYLSLPASGNKMPVSLSLNGTVETVNQFLRSIEYVPNSIFFGIDVMVISAAWDTEELLVVNDFSVSPLVARRELVLMVEAVDDPPTVEASNDMLQSMSDILHVTTGFVENAFIVNTEENMPFQPLLGLKVVDIDATLLMAELSCTIGQMKLLPEGSVGITIRPMTTTTTGFSSHQQLQLIGQIHNINACIEKLSYEPLTDWNGIDRIELTFLDISNNSVKNDSGDNGISAIIAVIVTQVNRSPVIHMPFPSAAIQCIEGVVLGETNEKPKLSESLSHLPYVVEDQVSVIGRHHIELNSIVEIQIDNENSSSSRPATTKNRLNEDMQSNSGILLSETSIYLSDPDEQHSSSLNDAVEVYYRLLGKMEEYVTLDLPIAEMGGGIYNVSLTTVHGLISISPSVPADLLLEVEAAAQATAGWMVNEFSFSSTLSVANQVLEGLSFVSERNFNTELFGDVALLKISVSDEEGLQSIGQLILPVYPENDPPVIVPSDGVGITQTYVTVDNVTTTHLTYDQQSPLVMSCFPFHIKEGESLNFAGWSVRDVDIVETSSMQSSVLIEFTAKAVFGSLVLEGSPQVSVLQRSEDGTLISFLATPDATTEALAKLQYFGGDFMWGSDTVTLTVNDMQTSGQCIIFNLSSGCSLSHTLTVPIEVEGVPSPPVVVMPWEGYAVINEDADLQLWGLYVDDVDATRHFTIDGTTTMKENCSMMIVNITVEEGTVTLRHQTKENLTWIILPVDNNSTDQEEDMREQEMIIAGSTASVNEALNGAIFRANSNVHTHGRQDLQVVASAYCQKDEEEDYYNGTNNELVGKGVLHVKVNSVNDYPEVIITQPEPLSWMEDEIFPLPFTVDDVDLQQGITNNVMPTFGYETLTVNMSCTHGSIVMRSTVGLQVIIYHNENQNHWWCIRGTRDAIRLALSLGKIVPEPNYHGGMIIYVHVSDDEGGWTENEIGIEIIPVDDPPSWKVPAYPISVGEGEAINMGELIELVDPDEDGDIIIELKTAKGSISLPLFPPAAGLEIDLEHSISPPFNISDEFNATWSRTLIITGPSPGLNEALKSLVYIPPKNWEEDFDTVTLVAKDTVGSGCGEAGLFIQIENNINDAPIVIPPGAILTSAPCSTTHSVPGLCYRVDNVAPLVALEDMQRSLEGLNIFDADAEKSPYALISIEMGAKHGTLSCLHVLCGNSGPSAMKLHVTGSLSTVNAALSSAWYKPHMDWYGNDTITIVANDNGFTGSGGSKEDSVTIDVQVEPQLDHPILLVDINSTWLSGLEDERVTMGPVSVLHADADAPRVHNLLYPISIMENNTSPVNDYVLTDPYIDLTAMAMNGHLMFGSTKGLRFLLPANGSDSHLTGDGLERSDEGIDPVVWWSAVSFRGKLSDVEASLQVVMYEPNSNWHGIDTVQFTAANTGDESPPIGMGGEINMSISIAPVADAPVLIVTGEVYDEALFGLTGDGLSMKAMPTVTLSGLEDIPIPITVLDIRDADYDEDPTLSITLNTRYGDVYLVEPLPLSAFVLEQVYGRVVLKCSNASVAQSALYGLAFVPEPDYSGLDAALTITIMDSTGLQDTRVINFEIAPQNDGPIITLPKEEGLYTVDEGESIWLNRAECPMLINSNYKQLFTRQLHGDELWGTFVGGQLTEEEWPIYTPGVINITLSAKYDVEEDFFLVKDIHTGPSGSSIRNMVLFQSVVYFTAETAGEGRELWRSDGSESGTVMVIDALPGPEGSNPQFLTVWGSYLYFTASGIDTTWMMGAYAGGDDVVLPSDECGGFRSSILNPNIAFAVAKNTTWDSEKRYDCPSGYHWASTAEGENIFRATYNNPLGSVGPVYSGLCGWKDLEWNGQQRERFRFSDSQETGAYKHAGKSETFRPDIDSDLDNLVLEGFAGIVCKQNSGSSCAEGDIFGSALINDCLKHSMADLWRTDGTILGTQRVSDIRHGRGSGSPAHLTIFNSSLWFTIEGMGNGSQLHCLREQNDTEVELMADFISEEEPFSSTVKMLTPAGNVLYILMSEQLWALEADPGSKPKLVSMPERFDPKFLIKYGDENSTGSSGSILMSGLLDSTGIELWALDGPEDTVRLVKDMSPGVRSSNPCHMTYWNNKVYFQANDGKHGPELWSSDGTTEGTILVEDIRPGAVGSYPSLLTPYKGELYMMIASDAPSSGPRLWKINGANNTASRVSFLVDPDFTSTEIFHPDIRAMESINVPPNGSGWGLGQMVGLDNSNILLVVGSKDQYGFNPPNHGLVSAEHTKFVRQAACVSDADPGDVLHVNISCNKCDLSVYEISGYVSHINHALENLTYTARATLTGWDTVVLTGTDAEGTSTQGEFSVLIQPVNNPPVILGTKEEGGLVDRIVNATQRHSENGGWEAFISGISIEDVDAMEGPMTLTLRVMEPDADIALDIPHSLAVLYREEGMIRVAGKLAEINQALSRGIFYNCDGNIEKEHESIGDQIHINVSDNGYTGKGGPKNDECFLSIRFLISQ